VLTTVLAAFLVELLAAVLAAVLAASGRWCCWRCWCRLAADGGGSSSLVGQHSIFKSYFYLSSSALC
jgi:hypothetical protein